MPARLSTMSGSSSSRGSTNSSVLSRSKLSAPQEALLKALYLVCFIYVGVAPGALGVPALNDAIERRDIKASRGDILGALGVFRDGLVGIPSDKVHEVLFKLFKNEHPDRVLVRFLQSRAWNLQDASALVAKAIRWRVEEVDLDAILERGDVYYMTTEPDREFIDQYKSGKATICGRDMRGNPVMLVNVAKHFPKQQSAAVMRRFVLAIVEQSLLFNVDDNEGMVLIFNMDGFSLANMDLSLIKFMIDVADTYYPGRLVRVFVHKAPKIFATAWPLIKPLMSADVLQKVIFTHKPSHLLRTIAADQLPAELGGQSATAYRWLAPMPGEDDCLTDLDTREKLGELRSELFAEFVEETIVWIQADDELPGNVGAQRDDLAAALQSNYWQMDPYIRSRGVYDRNGTLASLQPLQAMHSTAGVF